jgi:hypothetical protein
MDPGEVGIPNHTVHLFTAGGSLVATTTTDANGHYVFSTDASVATNALSKTVTLNFPDTKTNWSQSQQLPKFDPSLGKLSSVEIINQGTINSHIRVENLDQMPATINAQASGSLALSGPGLSFTPLASTQLQPNDATQSFQAAAFDGAIDYAGVSGHDFGTKTASGTQSITITDPATLAQYTGTGTLTFTETAASTSGASGPGNLQALINSTASAEVTVIYHYAADNSLHPGSFIIRRSSVPAGFVAGQNTAGNVTPLPNSVGSDSISVTLGTTDSTNNNFGLIKAAGLSGFVYADTDNDGVKQANEAGIPGSVITLSGTDNQGTNVVLTKTSAADGSYQFANLRPGSYTLKQDEPAGYFDGKDTIGSQGGTASTDQLSGITLSPDVSGVNNNFGELPAASVSGFVYVDAHRSGVRQPGDAPIANVAIALTGTDDQGNDVSFTSTTAADGSYQFANLRPGNYSITESQPAGFQEGKNTVGSLGGTVTGDQFSLRVNAGNHGVNYNFGEIAPPAPSVSSQGSPDQTTGVVTKREALMLFWQRRGIRTSLDSL